MEKKKSELDFSGESFYIGIDVHKNRWKITIRLNSMELKTMSTDPDPTQLYKHMCKYYPNGKYFSVYEAGFCKFWIHRKLEEFGIHNIIVNPADVPTTNKEQDRKCDAIDSAKLSRELENDSLRGIYIPTPDEEALSNVSRLHKQYTKRSTQIKNRIKSFVHGLGIFLPTHSEMNHWSKNFITFLREIPIEQEYNRKVLDNHLDELEHVRSRKLSVLRLIREISKEFPSISLLKTVPGIGQICSFALFTELGKGHRIKSLDKLASFIGLVPSVYSSDTKEIIRGITSRHCRHLRYLLIESSWIAIRKDPALTMSFANLCKGMTKQKAIIRIAKKLLNRIRYVLLNQDSYEIAIVG